MTPHRHLLALAAALAFATPAAANTYLFDLEGPDALSSFSFELPETLAIPADSRTGFSFTVFDVTTHGDIGFGPTDYLASYTFYTFGGFDGGYNINVYLGDLPMFEGGTTAPHFLAGSYDLVDFAGGDAYTLTITDLGDVVPEPASWALMIGGMGLAGGALRRRSDRLAFRRA